jgi:hypothetical protein
VNNIVEKRKQLKPNVVSSRISLPPPNRLWATRKLVKTPLSILNPLQRKLWQAEERGLHQNICLQPAAVPLMKAVWKVYFFK